MANIVVRNKNKVSIIDETGKPLLTFKGVNYSRYTKNFLEIDTYNPLFKYLSGGLNDDNVQKSIINLNTLNIVFRNKLRYIPNFSLRINLITDYVYLQPTSQCLFNKDNKQLLCFVEDFVNCPDTKDALIIKHIGDQYSFVYKDVVLIKYANFIKIIDNMLFVIKDQKAYLYTNYTVDNFDCMTCISSVKIEFDFYYAVVSVLNDPSNTKAICIKYYQDIKKPYIKLEIRSLKDLNDVITLDDKEYLKKDIIYGYPFVADYTEALQKTNYYSDLGYFEVIRYKDGKIDDSKFLELHNFKYLSEEYATNSHILVDCNNNKYLVLQFDNTKTQVYLLPDCKLIISGEYTDIKMCKSGKYFILENDATRKKRGLASLEGNVLLECNLYYLEETNESFLYTDEPFKEFSKISSKQ